MLRTVFRTRSIAALVTRPVSEGEESLGGVLLIVSDEVTLSQAAFLPPPQMAGKPRAAGRRGRGQDVLGGP